jgi:predicted RNA-binding Zn-ribbon protein involved in translation (DUF1610 family)
MIRITCSSCQKPLSLDETKLPMHEVAFPCPVCKVKLTIDRRKLGTGGEAEAGRAPVPAAPQAAPQAAQSPAAPQQYAADDDDHENEFGSKAMIVGTDHPAVRQAAKLVGYLPVHYADPVRAREFFNQELPQLVFLHPPQVTAPPLESMGTLMSVVPSERRRTFFVLLAENLRTLDGNAAFLYNVNLVVAMKDVGQFPQIFREAYAAHERLYAGMTAALREKHLS